MKTSFATIIGILFLQLGLLSAQTPGQPPVEACKPGDFTVIGWPNDFGPKQDGRFQVTINDIFDGGFLTTDPIWVPVIEQAVPKWNGIAGADWEFDLQGVSNEVPTPFDGKLTIAPCGDLFPCIEPPSGPPPGPTDPNFDPPPFGLSLSASQSVIAVTLVVTEGGIDRAIADSDIFFNPELPISIDPEENQIDFETVLLHELGHALGLDHNDNCVVGPTVMESVVTLGERRRNLESPENEGVKFLYPAEQAPAVRIFDRDASLRFDAVQGGRPPLSQPVAVFGANGGRWVPTATTSDGGDWVQFFPEAGRFPLDGTLHVAVDSASLPPGDYEAAITVNIEGHSGPPATIELELHVVEGLSLEEQPFLTRAGVVSSANMASAELAPGSLFTLFGEFLAPTTAEAQSIPLPTRLGGTEVLVNAVPAPLLYVSPRQINGQVPAEVQPGRGGVVVRTGLGQTQPIPLDLTETAPELFLIDGDQALILNQDGTVNAPDSPAAQGSLVTLFLSGQGPVSPPVASGRAAPSSPLSRVIPFSNAEVGGQEAEILFLGLAPGFVGLAQANIQLPSGLSGRLEVQLTIDENTSNVGFASVE